MKKLLIGMLLASVFMIEAGYKKNTYKKKKVTFENNTSLPSLSRQNPTYYVRNQKNSWCSLGCCCQSMAIGGVLAFSVAVKLLEMGYFREYVESWCNESCN